MELSISLTLLDYSAMLAYLVAVLFLGWLFMRGENTSEEYLLGGRRMPWYAVGISVLMSLLSTYSLVMVPGEIFDHGLSLWMLHLLAPLTTVLSFLLFIRFYFRLRSFTPFEYLERRYDKRVRLLVSIIVLYTRAMWLAMVLFSTAKVFEGGAGWPAWFTIILVGTIGIVYTTMGGMKAVIWTDVLQFVVLVGGMTFAIVVLARSIDGGAVGAVTYALEHGRGPTRFTQADFYVLNPYVRLTFWLMFMGAIMSPLTTASSDQVNIQRLLSTSSYKESFRAQITSACIGIPNMFALWFIGLAIFTYYSQFPDPQVTRGDTAFFTFVSTRLPPPVPGLFMAAMLAAVKSSLDSGMNSLATIWLKEIHLPYINRSLSEKRQVLISRFATVGVGLFAVSFALIIAVTSETLGHSVVEAASIFYALGVVVLPAFLFAVLSKKANSVMIWTLAALCWGMNFGTVTWHIATRNAARGWEEGMPLGLTGPISPVWFLVPLGLALLLGLRWALARKRDGQRHMGRLGLGLFPLGYSLSMLLWFGCSHLIPVDGPKVLSFQWVGFPGIVTFLILGTIYIKCSREEPREKWQGLTLSSMRQPLVEEESASESAPAAP